MENILIESEKTKKQYLLVLLPSALLFFIGLILMELATIVFSKSHIYDFQWELCGNLSVLCYVLATITFIVGVLFMYMLHCSKIAVTNKRIYGMTGLRYRVDLPIDSISAIGTSFLNGVDVSTSSGRLHFKCIKNNMEIHSIISNLLMERQQTEKSNVVPNNKNLSNADELQKYKNLLDNGVITQEEFDKKKRQLLRL